LKRRTIRDQADQPRHPDCDREEVTTGEMYVEGTRPDSDLARQANPNLKKIAKSRNFKKDEKLVKIRAK